MRSIKEDADAWRLKRAIDFIESIEIEDPDTGECVPVYETDPSNPDAYRKTARAKRIEARQSK